MDSSIELLESEITHDGWVIDQRHLVSPCSREARAFENAAMNLVGLRSREGTRESLAASMSLQADQATPKAWTLMKWAFLHAGQSILSLPITSSSSMSMKRSCWMLRTPRSQRKHSRSTPGDPRHAQWPVIHRGDLWSSWIPKDHAACHQYGYNINETTVVCQPWHKTHNKWPLKWPKLHDEWLLNSQSSVMNGISSAQSSMMTDLLNSKPSVMNYLGWSSMMSGLSNNQTSNLNCLTNLKAILQLNGSQSTNLYSSSRHTKPLQLLNMPMLNPPFGSNCIRIYDSIAASLHQMMQAAIPNQMLHQSLDHTLEDFKNQINHQLDSNHTSLNQMMQSHHAEFDAGHNDYQEFADFGSTLPGQNSIKIQAHWLRVFISSTGLDLNNGGEWPWIGTIAWGHFSCISTSSFLLALKLFGAVGPANNMFVDLGEKQMDSSITLWMIFALSRGVLVSSLIFNLLPKSTVCWKPLHCKQELRYWAQERIKQVFYL